MLTNLLTLDIVLIAFLPHTACEDMTKPVETGDISGVEAAFSN